jgi:hypothetical protein
MKLLLAASNVEVELIFLDFHFGFLTLKLVRELLTRFDWTKRNGADGANCGSVGGNFIGNFIAW